MRAQPGEEDGSVINPHITIANSITEYAKNLAAAEFGTPDEVEETFAIAA